MSISKKNQSDKLNKNWLSTKALLIIFFCVVGAFVYLLKSKSILPLVIHYWTKQLPQAGVGSPRLVDINNDSIKDIIIGSGFEWSKKDESAVNAIDGKTGEIIWSTIVPESAYGTPFLVDINKDGIMDTTASGRFIDVYMLNGKNGEFLWKLSEKNPEVEFLPCNFNSPTPIPDLDGDGIRDFVLIQGGLANNTNHVRVYNERTGEQIVDRYNKDRIVKAIKTLLDNSTDKTFSLRLCQGDDCEVKEIDRDMFVYYSFDVVLSKLFLNQEGPGGRVYVVSSGSGKVLNHFRVPMNRESWSVPIYFKHNNEHLIIYGSGGERKNGYMQSSNLETGELKWLVESPDKGVLSSPMLHIENDVPKVSVSTMGGAVYQLNAITGDVIWQANIGSEYESYSSVAPIKFKDKSTIDIVAVFSRGVWPKYESASLYILDGQTGKEIFRQKIGFCNGASSPIIADIDGDYLDDIVLITCTTRQPRLLVLSNDLKEIHSEPLDSGGFATPVVDDIDADGYTDIIVPRFHFISRFKVDQLRTQPLSLKWNQYRGVHWNGVLD